MRLEVITMSSMLDALNEEITRIQKLSELIAKDPKMEETILKFASEKMTGSTNGATHGRQKPPHSRRAPRTQGTAPQSQSSMLNRVITFIRTNGPSARHEILNSTKMAEGSFVHFMKDSGKFKQREDSKWELAD